MKVVLATPTMERPYPQYLEALEASALLLNAAGWESLSVFEVGNCYISGARATLLRKALDAKPDAIVFLDHDLSWSPDALLKLISTDDEVVAGTYRFKQDEESYMGRPIVDGNGRPSIGKGQCIKAACVPAGFLKVTPKAIDRFMEAYPELCYGSRWYPFVDLFNHGAHGRLWFGEDYAFCRRWNDLGGSVWLMPDLDITHHSTTQAYPGNFHQFLMRQPGGAADPNRKEAA